MQPNSNGGRRCGGCMAKERDKYHARAARGECTVCAAQATAGIFCFSHWLKNIGSFHKLNRRNGGLDMLRQLWDRQHGTCALTGVRLVPGTNASLDHIVPVSKGGPTVLDNLQWVLTDVNRAKFALSTVEFIALCRAVVLAADFAAVESTSSQTRDTRSN
jgi:hypothetical protein